LLSDVEVDHPGTAALAAARGRPADLATAATTFDEIAGFRIEGNPVDELDALRLSSDVCGLALKDGYFSDGSHES
jgi:hypothetical protein